jgi:hypothetical protein
MWPVRDSASLGNFLQELCPRHKVECCLRTHSQEDSGSVHRMLSYARFCWERVSGYRDSGHELKIQTHPERSEQQVTGLLFCVVRQLHTTSRILSRIQFQATNRSPMCCELHSVNRTPQTHRFLIKSKKHWRELLTPTFIKTLTRIQDNNTYAI